MKTILTSMLLLLAVRWATAQEDPSKTAAEVKVDLLKAPSSPASNLLSISPSEIEKPTDVSSFMLSLQSATTNFTRLPSNYAIDIAPYWLFKRSNKGDITTKGLAKSSGKNVFKQTLVLSLAFRNPDSTETDLNSTSAYGGLGIKFSILRGTYDETTKNKLLIVKNLQDKKLKILEKVMASYLADLDPSVVALRQQMKALFREGMTDEEKAAVQSSQAFRDLAKQLSDKLKTFHAEAIAADHADEVERLDNEIRQIASEFQLSRIGWTCDIAGGVAGEFRNKRFNDSKLYKAGVWITFGYTDSTLGSGLAIVRFLHNPDQIFAKDNAPNDIVDIRTLDAGLRYIYGPSQSKFNASIEAIYRSVLSSNTIQPSWRLSFNAEYAIWQNQKLTFSFGRNFDGTITKDGNLIAALTFLTGFGNRR